MTMYYLRTTDPDALRTLGLALGVLEQTDSGSWQATDGGTWTEIGHLPGEVIGTDDEGQDVRDVLRDDQGRVLWHANLETPASLRTRAILLAGDVPEIAAALDDQSAWFVVDEHGQPRAPQHPALSMWGAA